MVYFGDFETRKWNVAPLPPSQDHILPYMADERHAPDTWFVVAEEDWRLKAQHCNVNPVTLAAAGEATYRAWNPRRSYGFQEQLEEDSGIDVDALYRARLV